MPTLTEWGLLDYGPQTSTLVHPTSVFYFEAPQRTGKLCIGWGDDAQKTPSSAKFTCALDVAKATHRVDKKWELLYL